MPSALSADLRERVVTAIEAGASRREAARRFEVSPASAVRWHETFLQEGRTQAKPMGGDQRSHAVEAQASLIHQIDEAQPGLFLQELRDRLAERGLRVSVSSLSRFFKRHGITRKKHRPRGRAGSRGREGGPPVLVRGSARSRSGPARVPRRGRNKHEDGAALRASAARRAVPRRRPLRALENHHRHGRPARQRPDGHRPFRRADDRSPLPRLCRGDPGPGPEAQRHGRARQPARPQGRRHPRAHRGGRRAAAGCAAGRRR